MKFRLSQLLKEKSQQPDESRRKFLRGAAVAPAVPFVARTTPAAPAPVPPSPEARTATAPTLMYGTATAWHYHPPLAVGESTDYTPREKEGQPWPRKRTSSY